MLGYAILRNCPEIRAACRANNCKIVARSRQGNIALVCLLFVTERFAGLRDYFCHIRLPSLTVLGYNRIMGLRAAFYIRVSRAVQNSALQHADLTRYVAERN